MSIDFPSSPQTNEVYTFGSKSWTWNGTGWVLSSSIASGSIPIATSSITGVASFSGTYFVVGSTGHVSLTSGYQVTGDTVIAGTNITINRVGNAVTVNSTASGGGSVSLATDSITGVASFTANDFSVSPLGMVSLTGGIVRSFNGLTGNVTYSPVIATTSVTGVASFNSTYFSVAANGSVSLVAAYQVTGDTVVAGTNVNISRSGNSVTVNSTQPIASSSITGVASFTNNFVVSALGAVGLTSNIVNTVNGQTGNVGLPLATSSITGVASFNSTHFSVAANGAVSLAAAYQVTGDTVVAGTNVNISRSGNSVTVNSTQPLASSSITGVASFTNNFVVSALGAVGLTSNIVNTVNGRTGNVGLPLATTSITGFASFNLNDFVISSTGNVSLTDVFSGGATFNAAVSVAGSLTAHSLFVSQGATFNTRAVFLGGLTSSSMFVAQGATFNGSVTFLGGITASNLFIGGGATFNVVSANTVSANNLVTSVNGRTGNVALPLATTSITGVASFNLSHFSVSSTGNVSLISMPVNYTFTDDFVVDGSFVSLTSDIVRSFNGQTGNVTYSPRLATNSLTGVASFGNEFVVSSLGAVSLTGNYVQTFNGLTGSVAYAPPLATTSVTGVASFNNSQFVVSATGNVSLTASYEPTLGRFFLFSGF